MDLSPAIAELDANCARCKIRQAASLLREIQEDLQPAQPIDAMAPAEPPKIDYPTADQMNKAHLGEPAIVPVKAEETRLNPTQSVSTRNKVTQPVTGRGLANANERSADGKSKVCHGACGLMLPLTKYPEHKQCQDGHTGTCYKCTRARALKNYHARQARKGKESTPKAPKAARTAKPSAVPENYCEPCDMQFRSLDTFHEHNRMRHAGVGA